MYTFLKYSFHFQFGCQATRNRIRQCQIFLNDPELSSDAGLRDSLETIRSNAEEDFGSFLHILTVYKAKVTLAPPGTGESKHNVPHPAATQGLVRTKRDVAQSEQDDEEDDQPIEMK